MKPLYLFVLTATVVASLFACSDPASDANVMLNRAKGYAECKEFSVAKSCAQKVVEIAPNDMRGYLMLAMIDKLKSQDPKDLNEAIENAQKAVALAPQSFEANHLAGRLMIMQNPFNVRSLPYFETASKIDPTRLDNLLLLANTCLNCRQPRRAYEVYKRLLFFPQYRGNFELNNQVGFALARINELEAAEQFFKKAISLSAGHPMPQLNLARLYDYKLKQPQKALMAYEQYCVNASGQIELLQTINDVKKRMIELKKTVSASRIGR